MRQTATLPAHAAPRRRRPWLMALPLGIFLLIAVAWSVFWFFAASRADKEIAGWRAREAQAGRVHTCGEQSIAGFPFRIEVRCTQPSLEFRTLQPPLSLAARDSIIVAQVYDPKLLIGEFSGPMVLAENGQPSMTANWRLAQVSARGTPAAPERVSVAVDDPAFSRLNRGTMEPVATASHLELHGRIAGGSVADNPVIETVLRLAKASAPTLHPAAARPTDAEIDSLLFGLKDFSPKPWSARLREMAANGGHIEIKQARLVQDDILVVGAGTLNLTSDGRLDGQLTLSVVGLDKLVTLLGVDQMVQQYLAQQKGGNFDKLAGSLDRILPGLGGAVRNNSGALATIGIAMLGEPREIEGRKGVSLPLRLQNGAAFLGPVAIGQVPPLF